LAPGGEKACGGEVDAPFGGSGTSTMTLKAALIKWRLFVTWQKLELSKVSLDEGL